MEILKNNESNDKSYLNNIILLLTEKTIANKIDDWNKIALSGQNTYGYHVYFRFNNVLYLVKIHDIMTSFAICISVNKKILIEEEILKNDHTDILNSMKLLVSAINDQIHQKIVLEKLEKDRALNKLKDDFINNLVIL